MTNLPENLWREVLSMPLALVGVALLVRGVYAGILGRMRSPLWPQRALVYLYAFRRVALGLALLGASFGVLLDVGWLLAASVCIGLGELLESSYYIGVLRWGQERGSIQSG